jgi:hypothetical protein
LCEGRPTKPGEREDEDHRPRERHHRGEDLRSTDEHDGKEGVDYESEGDDRFEPDALGGFRSWGHREQRDQHFDAEQIAEECLR